MSGNTATLPSPGLPLMTHGPPQHLKQLAATQVAFTLHTLAFRFSTSTKTPSTHLANACRTRATQPRHLSDTESIEDD